MRFKHPHIVGSMDCHFNINRYARDLPEGAKPRVYVYSDFVKPCKRIEKAMFKDGGSQLTVCFISGVCRES